MKLIGLSLCLLVIQTGMAQTDSAKLRILKSANISDTVFQQWKNNKLFGREKRAIGTNEFNKTMILQEKRTLQEQSITIDEDREKRLQVELGTDAVAAIIIEAAQEELPARKRHSGPSQFDSRIELRALNPLIKAEQKILSNARSVGLIIRKENLEAVTDSFFRINTGLTLGSKYNLCTGQAFAQQPVAGEGTAFIINGNTPQVMTASHVFTEPIDHYALVFGYEVLNQEGSDYETLIPLTDIYYLTQVLYKDDQLDVAVAALNRSTDRLPLKFATSAPVLEQDVYMIGYPCGLPAKVAMNAGVKENNHPQYFYTSLDAFQGNSGSPVFNMNTHEIIGILVSGEVDFIWNGSCNAVSSCRIPYCKGEKVIRVQTISDYTISQTPRGGSLPSLPQ